MRQWAELKTGSSDEVETIVLTRKVEQETEAEVRAGSDCKISSQAASFNRSLVILVSLGGQARSDGVISRFEFMKFQFVRDGHQDGRYVVLIRQYQTEGQDRGADRIWWQQGLGVQCRKADFGRKTREVKSEGGKPYEVLAQNTSASYGSLALGS